jgi:hypothetical protein
MAKKRASSKSSTRSEPPLPPKDKTIGKQPSRLASNEDIAFRRKINENDMRIRTAQMNLDRAEMDYARSVSRGKKTNLNPTSLKQAQQNLDAMKRQSPQGSRYSPKTSRPSNIPVSRLPDKLSGRTVEGGTRSMLQGLRSWITGGGGSIRHGR